MAVILSACVVLVCSGLAVASALGSSSSTLPVSDSFDRTTNGTWGQTTSGLTYTYPWGTTKDYRVADGVGSISLRPGTGGIARIDVPASSVDVTVTTSVATTPNAANGVFSAIHARRIGGQYYRLVTRFTPSGHVAVTIDRIDGAPTKVTTLASGLSGWKAPGGVPVTARLAVTGDSHVALTATVTGPSGRAVQLGYTDSSDARIATAGSTELWGYVSSGSGPNTVSFDDLSVKTIGTPATPSPTTKPTTTPTTPPTPTTAPTTQATAPATVVPSSPPSTTPAPLPDTGGNDAVGSAPLGSASYPVPANAIIVSPTGSDGNAGSVGSPVRTVTRAIALAKSGGTIVLRAGAFHESVIIPSNKTLTLQNYPGEAAWLDGSRVISGFTRSGSTWVYSGWTTQFDASPTYTRGAPDGTEEGWQWINPKYPMAAHPDQVWIGDKPLRQVGSRAAVTSGTFFVDYAADQIVLGSDPGTGTVRSSDLGIALTVTSPNSVVRGIGIMRFAPSVPDMGALRLAGEGATVENTVVSDNATQGITSWAADVSLRRVTVARNGLTGIHAHRSDRYVVDRVLSDGNNAEHFNKAPVSAGLKISSSRGITITDSQFSGNDGSGLWFDVSDYDATVTGNTISGNTDHGLIFELSSKLYAVDNTITDNASQSFFVLDSDQVRFWNNEIRGSLIPIRISDTDRDAQTGPSYGYDKRRPIPDPTVSWEVDSIEIRNNVIADIVRGNNWCGLLCVRDHENQLTGEQMRVTLDGNVYQRPAAGTTSSLIQWANGAKGLLVYPDLAAFRAARGQESRGTEIIGPLPSTLPSAGVPLPADIAATLGARPGSTIVGPTS